MPVIDFTPITSALATPIASIVVGIGAVAAIVVAIPIARSAWDTIIGFISRRR